MNLSPFMISRWKLGALVAHATTTGTDQLLSEEVAAAGQRGIKDCRYVNFPALNHYTIVFGIEGGPAREIRSFVGEE